MSTKCLRVAIIAGARPNFMKVASLIHAIKSINETKKLVDYKLIHTGQHYDKNLSDVFFEDLDIPLPDVNLEVGSGTQSFQTGHIMIKFEEYLKGNHFDWIIVVGDVNSTLACSIVGKKLGIKVAHVEAGLMSNDMSMPEEINRLVTDSICDLYFTTTLDASLNLARRGIDKSKVYLVGNTMIDTLIHNMAKFRMPDIWSKMQLQADGYFLLTLHRPSNVDDENKLKMLLDTVLNTCQSFPVLFPVHPRTKSRIDNLNSKYANLITIEPMRYLEFLFLLKNAKAVITDSGGVQEETTFLKVPCLTLRKNTERPETVAIGTNMLLGEDVGQINEAIARVINKNWKEGQIPLLWDGETGKRIINTLINYTES